jgi:hypothetical protein
MKYMLVKLAPEKGFGFGNQMYALSNALQYAIENKYNIMFLTEFLNEIHTNSYSNVSDILDIEKTNNFLSQYNIQIADINKYNFDVVDIQYGYNNYFINIIDSIKQIITNSIFHIPTSYSFYDIHNIFLKEYQKKYGILLNNSIFKLRIVYRLDNKNIIFEYNIVDNHLSNEIKIDLTNIVPYAFSILGDTKLYYDIRTNLVYNHKFKEEAMEYLKTKNINANGRKINCIHLKLEEDAINHYVIENKQNKEECKRILEQKYISEIISNINKDDLTIVLSGDYNNNVMKFLKDNNYNFITTPKWTKYRDVSALYDLHIADICNNIYIGVFESTFSYLILYRIRSQISKFVQIYFTKPPYLKEQL